MSISYEDVRDDLENGKYTPVYPEEPFPQALPKGYITDRKKSVAWNEEQVDLSIRAQKKWSAKRRELDTKANDLFCNDLESAIMDDISCNLDQAYIIFDAAHDLSDDRYSRIEHAESYADLIRRFAEAGGK